ncbi:MAG: TMEM165/GDT1 family protein [Methylocystaceae bacterium]
MSAFFIGLSTYVLIVLCELGDKTQLATLMLASNHPGKRWLVFGAAALALCSCVAVEVTVGQWLAGYIGIGLINQITGVLFLIIGVSMLGGLLWEQVKKRPTANRQLQWEDAN